MTSLADVFKQDDSAPAMIAPGIPQGALSGSPQGTLANLIAVGGAQAGDRLGGAISNTIGYALGQPPVDPVAMRQGRQEEFLRLIDQERAAGKTEAEAILSAAELARKSGALAPDEYLTAITAGREQATKERDFLSKTTDNLAKSGAIRDYQKAVGGFKELLEIAKRGEAGDQSANDFVLIQQGLKVLDPGSVVSANELMSGKIAARGSMALDVAGIKLNKLLNYSATGGAALELTSEQKAKWLRAIASAVDGQKNAAATVYLAGRDAYTAGGGALRKFEQATGTTNELLQYDAFAAVSDADDADLITAGRGFNSSAARITAGLNNLGKVYTPILKGFGDAAKDAALDTLFGIGIGDSEDNKPSGPRPNGAAPRMGRGAGGKDLYQDTSGDLTRMLAPVALDQALLSSYPTNNILHAMTMDALNGNNITNTIDAFSRAALVQPVSSRRRRRFA